MTEEGRLADAAGADALNASAPTWPSLNHMAAARDFVVYNSVVNSLVF